MKYLFTLFTCSAFSLLFSQAKYDYNWFVATQPQADPDYGMTRIYFSGDTLGYEKIGNAEIDINMTNASWSNSNGELQFMTNGCQIVNKEFAIIENGDSINPGEYHDDYCKYGYIVIQGALILPNPADDSKQYVFHVWLEDLSGSEFDAQKLLYSYIDMNYNNDFGAVVEKNQTVIHDTISSSQLTAVKHGNGEDWWLLMPENSTNGYYKILLDENGPEVYDKQYIGSVQDGRDWGGQAVFSPDGSIYFRADGWSGIEVFDFDRCNGTLAGARHIDLPFETVGFLVGAAISPNSRYAYVSSAYELVQYDLWADDIAATADTVGIYDGFQSWLPAYFFLMQLAPDGKIYMTTGNGTNVLHVIHNPDEPGDSCNFEQHAITLPTYYSFAPPNFPNYRLGPLGDGSCAPNAAVEAELPVDMGIEIYPNPADSEVLLANPNAREGLLSIYNHLGALTHQHRFRNKESSYRINISDWNSGIYPCLIHSDDTGESFHAKLVVAH